MSESALETYLATEEATRATQISLVAEVIQAYLTRDGSLRRKALVEQTLDSRLASLELVSRRREVGAATALDYQEAVGLAEQARGAEGEVVGVGGRRHSSNPRGRPYDDCTRFA